MRKIEYVVSNERLITPERLIARRTGTWQVKSDQKSKPYADRKAFPTADKKRRYPADYD